MKPCHRKAEHGDVRQRQPNHPLALVYPDDHTTENGFQPCLPTFAVLGTLSHPLTKLMNRLGKKRSDTARGIENQTEGTTPLRVAKDFKFGTRNAVHRETNHEPDDFGRRQVLTEFLFINKRVGQKLSEHFVQNIEAREVERRGLALERFKTINQLASQLIFLRLQFQFEVPQVH